MPPRLEHDAPGTAECFLGFELAEDSRAYLQSRLAAAYQGVVDNGWSGYLVRPDKLHASFLYYEHRSPGERTAVWSEVEAAVKRDAWKNPGFQWLGLEYWPHPGVVVLASESYNALERWGLESWLDHPICRLGDLKSLRHHTPHFTVIRLKGRPAGNPARAEKVEEWRHIHKQLEPIDPQRIKVDRITFFLVDYSRGYHRYIRENTIKIL